MRDLEEELKEVEKLKRDLSAEIGIREEERESAKTQLQQIYENSEWYSARYSAGMSLGVDKATLSEQMQTWEGDLWGKLRAYEEGTGTTRSWFVNESDYNFGGPEDNYWVEGPEIVEDIGTRINAVYDLDKLFKLTKSPSVKSLLKEGYGGLGNCQPAEVVKVSGKALGYSSARIFLHIIDPTNTMFFTMGCGTMILSSLMILAYIFPPPNSPRTAQKTNEQTSASYNLNITNNTER